MNPGVFTRLIMASPLVFAAWACPGVDNNLPGAAGRDGTVTLTRAGARSPRPARVMLVFPGKEEPPHLTLPALARPRVRGGTFSAAKTGGTAAGRHADPCTRGTSAPRTASSFGEKTLTGVFVTHGVAWC